MLRSRKKDVSLKPSRKLDRRTSRGVVYENEELRMRTVEISAEVERGQSEVKKLKKENDTLKREIWWLREECEKLAGVLNVMGVSDSEEGNKSGGAVIEEIADDGNAIKDFVDAENMENLQKDFKHNMMPRQLGNYESFQNVKSAMNMMSPRNLRDAINQSPTHAPTAPVSPTHIPMSPMSCKGFEPYSMLPEPNPHSGITYVILPQTHPVFNNVNSSSESLNQKDARGILSDDEMNLDHLTEAVECFQRDQQLHETGGCPPVLLEDDSDDLPPPPPPPPPPPEVFKELSETDDSEPDFSTIRRTTKAYVEKVRTNGEETQVIRQGSVEHVEVLPEATFTSKSEVETSTRSFNNEMDRSALSVFHRTSASSVVRLNSIEPNTLMFSIANLSSVTTPEVIDELESQLESRFQSVKGVRVTGESVYICLKEKESLYHLLNRGLTLRNVPVTLVDLSSDTLVIALCGIPHYVADNSVNLLMMAFGKIMGEIERRYYKGIDTGERFVRLKLEKGVKLPKILSICGCKIGVRLLKPEEVGNVFKTVPLTGLIKKDETSCHSSPRLDSGLESGETLEQGVEGDSSLEPIPEAPEENEEIKTSSISVNLKVDLPKQKKGPAPPVPSQDISVDQSDFPTRCPSIRKSGSREATPKRETVPAPPIPPLSSALDQHTFSSDSESNSPVLKALKRKLRLQKRNDSQNSTECLSSSKYADPSVKNLVNFEDNRREEGLSQKASVRGGSTKMSNGILRNTSLTDEPSSPGFRVSRLKLHRGSSFDIGKTIRSDRKKYRGSRGSVITTEAEVISPEIRRKDSDKSLGSSSRSSRQSSKSREGELPWCGCWGNGCF